MENKHDKIDFTPVDIKDVVVEEDEIIKIDFKLVDGSCGIMFINTDDDTGELKSLFGTLFGVRLRAKLGTIVKQDKTKLTVLKFFIDKPKDETNGKAITVKKNEQKNTKADDGDKPF